MIGTLLSLAAGVGSKMIEDKDKKTEFAFKVLELTEKRMEVLINKDTYKWVDAVVKLAYASEQIMKGLLRPVGSAIMTGAAVYCSINGIELDPAVQAVLIAAFPAWGASRHVEKKKVNQSDIEEW